MTKVHDRFLTLTGVILPYGGTSAPDGWLMCDGTSYARASYPELFAVIGTAFGTADGASFNVPDFRGRFLRGADGGVARDPDRAARTAMNPGGNIGDNVGSIQVSQFGAHTHTASSGNTNLAHTHSVSGSTSGGGHEHTCNQLNPTPGATCAAAGGYSYPATSTSGGGAHSHGVSGTAASALGDHSHTVTVNAAGGEPRPINAYVNYIIRI
jgi:microcystin-dependent protein